MVSARAKCFTQGAERDGCSDYEVEVPGGAGLDTTEQRQGFLVEARQVGFSVTFEAPCCYAGNDRKEHDWEAVFGHRPTLEAATALELRAIAVGYSHLVVERDGPSDYEVALPGGAGLATARGRASFAAEARTSSAHLSVVFERS